MLISDFQILRTEGRVRSSALVRWEDCDRPDLRIYFETSAAHEDHLNTDPQAFMVACVMPALEHQERRIRLEASLCPQLRIGLIEAMKIYRHWNWSGRTLPEIEAHSGACTVAEETALHPGLFLSGGIDSIAALRFNRQNIPANHPSAFRIGIFVYGFDMGWDPGAPDEVVRFERATAALVPIADESGIQLITVNTNIRHLEPDSYFWIHRYHGSALAAVGHALSRKMRIVHIAASHDVSNVHDWGSHPLTDPCFSSCRLLIRYEGLVQSRSDKARIVVSWDTALRAIRVCPTGSPNNLNCGRCEKCIRTMLLLMEFRKLNRAESFEQREVTVETLSNITLYTPVQVQCFKQQIPDLESSGRFDLVKAIHQLCKEQKRYYRRVEEKTFRGWIKRVDRRFFAGALVAWVRSRRQKRGIKKQ